MKAFIDGKWRVIEDGEVLRDSIKAIIKTWLPVIGYVLAGLVGVLFMGVIR